MIFNRYSHIVADSCFGLGFFAALFFLACSGEESVNVEKQPSVVSLVSELPECNTSNEGANVLVDGESTVRICADGKWYAAAADTVYESGKALSCKAKKLKDGSGIKILCNGDSIGVILNGENGEKGERGSQGESGGKGVQGDPGDQGNPGEDGASCSIKKIDEQSVRVYCGTDSTTLYIGEPPDTVSTTDPVTLDSEKVAVSLDEVSGVSQKGPFLTGSKVRAYEILDGRTLKQSGNMFNGKILDDNGEFRLNARTLVSQYLALEATGYYRNEVTGENSNSELTLFAITDVSARNMVNINLLTHLEYERVYYLVTQEKKKVKDAKKQAQKEVFGLLLIDATDFSNSEDLNVTGSSAEDGALLAFSVMLQGDRSVAELSELLTKIATEMEKDGTWDDANTKLLIADWCADADSSLRYPVIRNNVKNWGISVMIPDFETYLRHFWNTEYGLGECNQDSLGIVKAASAGKRKGSKTRYICKAASEESSELIWMFASDLEKDTYQWKAGKDIEIRAGSITQKSYIYDAEVGSWRGVTLIEEKLGGCNADVEKDETLNNGFFNGYAYKCENRVWTRASAFVGNTDDWVSGSDGDVVKREDGAYYVFDEAEGQWREADEMDWTLGLKGCTTNRTGDVGQNKKDLNYYMCQSNHLWGKMGKVAYNTVGIDCDEDGKMELGLVNTMSYFVCENGNWREASINEELAGESCTASKEGMFNQDSTWLCDKDGLRYATVYDFPVDKDWTNPDKTYGTLVDDRDGQTYKTIKVGENLKEGGYTIMAQNLNYHEDGLNGYLIGNNWCYNDDSTNCLKGGRFYTWTAAMDVDPKWKSSRVPKVYVSSQHQGICPKGWHIPTWDELEILRVNGVWDESGVALGNLQLKDATNENGLSILATGHYRPAADYYKNGSECGDGYCGVGKGYHFWSATEHDDDEVYAFGRGVATGQPYKREGLSVRCFENYEEGL